MPPVFPPQPSFFAASSAVLRSTWHTVAGKIVLIGIGAALIGTVGFGIFVALRPPATGTQPAGGPNGNTQESNNGAGGNTQNPAAEEPEKKEEAKPSTPQAATDSNTPAPTGGTGSTSTGDGSTSGGSNGGGSSEPEAFKANCITVPSSCGYPDATNTGVPAGTSLTSSGSFTITQDDTVINGRNITGQIVVRANNVTIRNTRITSGDYYPIDYDGGYTGLLVEDTEIVGLNTNVTAGISFRDYTARRVYVHGTVDGLKADANVLVEDSFVTSLRYDPINDTHNDGLQTTGGSNVTVRHNTFKLSDSPDVSAVIQIGTEWGGNTNWLVTNNLFDGGGYVINSGTSNATMKFTNNRFTRAAGYGSGHPDDATWTGNYYDNDNAIVP